MSEARRKKIEGIDSLLALFLRLKDGTVALTDDLPTFGGHEPYSKLCVWSWDEDRVIWGRGLDDIEILCREEVGALAPMYLAVGEGTFYADVKSAVESVFREFPYVDGSNFIEVYTVERLDANGGRGYHLLQIATEVVKGDWVILNSAGKEVGRHASRVAAEENAEAFRSNLGQTFDVTSDDSAVISRWGPNRRAIDFSKG